MHTVIQGDFPHLYDKIAETCHQAKVLEQIFVRYDIIQFFIKQNEVHYPKFGANHVLYVVYNAETTEEQLQQLVNDKVKANVEEFVGKFLTKPAMQSPENVKDSFYASNLQLTKLLSRARRNRSVHLRDDSFLVICECEDCKTESNTVDTQS
uniref:HDC14780 n=1 Tax=Drosophila melanogaster TaxID=7227 RepID=Q6IJK0_DROME|nr:TPA_inf: HDC14780 [Drosophila melanogaster]